MHKGKKGVRKKDINIELHIICDLRTSNMFYIDSVQCGKAKTTEFLKERGS